MSRIGASIISLVLVILLSGFFYISPKYLSQKTTVGAEAFRDLLVKRFTTMGNVVAHAAFVEDAVIMGDNAKLEEIITNLRSDEPEITFIHFTNSKNKVIASSDANFVGETYNSNILTPGSSMVRENNGAYEGRFSINIGNKAVGALYFVARPKIPSINTSASPNPIVPAAGIGVALLILFITFFANRGLEKKLLDDMSKRQEELFLPKIDALKKQQAEAQKAVTDMEGKLKSLNDEFEAKRREMVANPVFQSVETLKITEAELLSRYETLKEKEAKLDKEVELLVQKREEILGALEAEKKEESILHEKLALIKKKILRLETPDK